MNKVDKLYKPFSEDEERRLVKRYRDGMSIQQLAAIHGRNKAAIAARLARLGLITLELE